MLDFTLEDAQAVEDDLSRQQAQQPQSAPGGLLDYTVRTAPEPQPEPTPSSGRLEFTLDDAKAVEDSLRAMPGDETWLGRRWNDITTAGKLIGQGLYSAAVDVLPKTAAEAIRGGDVSLHPEETSTGRFITEQQQDLERWNQPTQVAERDLFGLVKGKDLLGGLQNLGYSAGAMAAGLGAGAVVGSAVGPGYGTLAGAVAGGLSGGAMAYRATKDQFVNDIRQKMLANDPGLTEAKWREARAAIENDASLYGLWEAVPEAIGDALGVALIKAPAGKIIEKIPYIRNGLARMAASAGAKLGLDVPVELGTETITQHGQGAIEAKHGLREQAPTWGEAFQEVAPQTMVMSLATMGLGHVAEHYTPSAQAVRRDTGLITDAVAKGEHRDLSDEELGKLADGADKLLEKHPNLGLRDAIGEIRAEQERRANAPAETVVPEATPTPEVGQEPAQTPEQIRVAELAGMSHSERRDLAKSLGIEKLARFKKDDLIAEILKAETATRVWNEPEAVERRYQEEHAAPFETGQDTFLNQARPAPELEQPAAPEGEAGQIPTPEQAREAELAGMSHSERRSVAKSLGIEKPGRFKKDDLVAEILQAEATARAANEPEAVERRYQEEHAAPFETGQDAFLNQARPGEAATEQPAQAGLAPLPTGEIPLIEQDETPASPEASASALQSVSRPALVEQTPEGTLPNGETPLVETGEATGPIREEQPEATATVAESAIDSAEEATPQGVLPTGEIPLVETDKTAPARQEQSATPLNEKAETAPETSSTSNESPVSLNGPDDLTGKTKTELNAVATSLGIDKPGAIKREDLARRIAEAQQTRATSQATAEGPRYAMSLRETTHVKKGHPLYVVTMDERTSREEYDRLKGEFSKLGGYWSSYRGRGAIPGIQFTDKAKAEQFLERFGKGAAPDQRSENPVRISNDTEMAPERLRQPEPQSLGVNCDGMPVFQDENGNRSVVEDGVRIEAPVPVTPTRSGVSTRPLSPEELFRDRHHDFLTRKELAGFQGQGVASAVDNGYSLPEKKAATLGQNASEEATRGETEATHSHAGQSGPDVGLEGASGLAAGEPSPGDLGAVPGKPGRPEGSHRSEGAPVGQRPVRDEGQERPGGRDRGGDAGRGGTVRRSGPERGESAGTAAGTAGATDLAVVGGPAAARGDGAARRDVSRDHNHRIAPDDVLVPGGNATRAKANVEAVRLLKRLEAENRLPTPEERKTLAQFSGWGSLAEEVFKTEHERIADQYGGEIPLSARNRYYGADIEKYDAWRRKYGELHPKIGGLLTKEEWDAAKRSTLNAHYTDRQVISAMWDMVQQLGFSGGRVVEPAAGIGHFFGLMPENLAKASDLRGVELDSVTGRLLGKLYPAADIQVTGFQDAKRLGNNTADLVISNVPFGDFPIHDKTHKDYSGWSIHNYFLARSLDVVRPGGLVVAITSHFTMDTTRWGKAREYLANKADLVGAIRLPGTAFAKNAGTEVTTDILVLRKKDEHPFEGQPWRMVDKVDTPEGQTGVNEYFVAHPEMVLGRHSLAGSMYGGKEYTVLPDKARSMEGQLRQAIASLPVDILGEGAGNRPQALPVALGERAGEGMREGAYVLQDGQVFAVEDGRLARPEWQEGRLGERRQAIAREYVGVKTAAADLVRDMLSEEATDADIAAGQKRLDAAYDAFVGKHGPFLENRNLTFLRDDVEFPNVLALEKKEDRGAGEKKQAVVAKADIFTKRTIRPFVEPKSAGTLEDAAKISLLYRGKLDTAKIGELLGVPAAEARRRLLETGAAFENPATGLLETSQEYLSGNVREKLREAKDSAGSNPDYKRNVEALEAVQPSRKPISRIDARLGATWIPDKAVAAFMAHLGVKNAEAVQARTYAGEEGLSSWDVKGWLTEEARNRWTVNDTDLLDILRDSLNLKLAKAFGREPEGQGGTKRVVDQAATMLVQEKQKALQAEFLKFVRETPGLAKELEGLYDETFGGQIPRQYNVPEVAHYPGAVETITLRAHQKRGVARCLQENTLLAHGVGAGKTYLVTTLAMESRRLGTAKKPMIVVQGATLEQFASAFKRLYPAARVLAPNAEDRTKANRQRLLSQVATGDWDAVIVPHSFFNGLAISPERERAFIDEELDSLRAELREAGSEKSGDRKSTRVKQIEKMIAKREVRLEALLDARKDENVFFEDTGVDMLVVDEAHAYKRGDFVTKMDNVKGLDRDSSQRSMQLLLKSRFIAEKTGGKNVHLATGTPVSNTLAELWTMLRYIRPDLLERFHVTQFDDFASTFCATKTEIEETATGDYKPVTRFNRYQNLGELISMWRAGADIVLAEDLDAIKDIPKLKGGRPQEVSLERNPVLAGYIQHLKQWRMEWEKLSGLEKRKQSHVPLLIYNLAQKAALDMRLVRPDLEEAPGGKLEAAANEIYRRYVEHGDTRAAQAVFSDIYQSSDKSFNIWKELKKKLVELGIPAKEIAIVYDYSEKAREKLFAAVNAGDVRVVMGSTEKLGVGVNIQERLEALHHLSPPVRPMDWEQRNGRIRRQGNMFPEVEVLAYGVKNTLDSVSFNILQNKQKFINQLLRGEIDGDVMENPFDDVQLSFEDMMAAFSGNPLAMERVKLEGQVRDLGRLRQAFQDEKAARLRQLGELQESRIPNLEKNLDTSTKEVERLSRAFPGFKAESFTLKNGTFDRKDFTARLTQWFDGVQKRLEAETVGKTIGHYETVRKKFRESVSFETGGYTVVVTVKPVPSSLVGADSNRQDGLANVTQAMLSGTYEVTDKRNNQLFSKNFGSPAGFIRSFNNGLEEIAREPATVQASIDRARQSAASLKKLVEEQFSREEEFQQATERLRQVEAELKAAKNEDLVAAPAAQADQEQDGGGPVMLRRADVGAVNSPRATQEVVAAFQQGLAKFPALRGVVDLYHSEADMPEKLRRKIAKMGVSGNFYGAYDPETGRISFVGANIPSQRAGQIAFVNGLLRHEGRHGGLDLILGGLEARQDYMTKAARIMPREVARWLERRGLDSTRETRARAAEEILVEWSKTGCVHRTLDKLLARIAEWVRTIFPNLSLTKAELRALLAQADDFVDGRLDFVAPLDRPLVAAPVFAQGETPVSQGYTIEDATMPREAATFREAREASREFVGKEIANDATGMVATVSRTNIGKMLSESAVRKSASPAAHSLAVANLDKLFRNAEELETHPDRDGSPSIKTMHRLYAPMLYGDAVLVAKMTVKEFADPREGTKIYSVESMEIEKAARNWEASISPGQERISSPQAAFSEKAAGNREASFPMGRDRITSPQATFLERIRRLQDQVKGESGDLRLAQAGDLAGVPAEPSRVSHWLKHETTAQVRSILPAVRDKLKETGTLGKIVRSPEYWQHPMLKKLYEIFRDRPDKAHELLHEALDVGGDKTVLDMAKTALADPKQRAVLADDMDYADVNEIQPEQTEARLREHGATDATVALWRVLRDKYDLLLDKRLESYRKLIDQARKEYEQKIQSRLVKAGVDKAAAGTFDAAAYNADRTLSPELAGQAEAVRRVVAEARQAGITIKGQLADVRYVGDDGKPVTISLEEAVERMGQLRGFYAPRLREEGDYVVRGERTREDGTVERFRAHKEWRAGAEKLRATMARDGWTMEPVGRVEKLPEATQGLVKALELAKTVESAARKTAGDGVDAAMVAQLVEQLAEDIKARGFRAQSIRRQERHGEVVKGYLTDPMERFTRYAANTAYGLAKMDAAGKAIQALFGTKEVPGVDMRKEADVHRLAVDYIAENLRNAEAGDRVFSLAKSMASLKYLGLNPRSAIVNLSSMATSVPAALHAYAMEGKGGWARVGREIARSMYDYLGVMTGKWGRFSAEEKSFLDAIRKEALDDPQFAREALSTYRDTAGKTWSWLMRKSLLLFGATEQLNRGATLLAAYRLARAMGADHATAVARARETSDRAHGVYSRATQPAWTWGTSAGARVGQGWYVYKKYGHNYLQLVHELFGKKDYGAATFALVSPMVLTGLGSQVLTSLVKGIFAAAGSDDDPEKWVYDTIRANLGGEAEDLARFGLLGLLTGSDLHGSIGTMIDIPDTWTDVLGPIGGLARDVLVGIGYFAGGQPGRGLEKILPTGAAKVIQALREQEQGVTTSKNYPVIGEDGKPLQPTVGETVAKAAGFRPLSEAQARSKTAEAITEEKRYGEERDRLYARFRAFVLDGAKDRDERDDILSEIKVYNQKVAEAGMSGRVSYITASSLLKQSERLAEPTKREKARIDGGRQKRAEEVTGADIEQLGHPFYAIRRRYEEARQRYDDLREAGNFEAARQLRSETQLPRLRLVVGRVQTVHALMSQVRKAHLPETEKRHRLEILRDRERREMDRATGLATRLRVANGE